MSERMEMIEKGTFCYLEKETLTDGSIVYNVVVYEEMVSGRTGLIPLRPSTKKDAIKLFEAIEKLA